MSIIYMSYNNRIIFLLILFILVMIFQYYYRLNQSGNYLQSDTYLHSNDWSSVLYTPPANLIDGIEVRTLPPSHLLAGQKGVFATKELKNYDVIGEYTGVIRNFKDINADNLYIFSLVDDIVIDGNHRSNELKYVNSYLNIATTPNLRATHCTLDRYPKILYICTKDIAVGEELLIDYGEEYNNAHILK
jgi:hypothetical protein